MAAAEVPAGLRQRLRGGQLLVGTWLYIAHPDVAEILSLQGFDWLLIDLEHGALGPAEAQRLMQAMRGSAVPLVRVPPGDWSAAGRLLDAGAHGVVFPMVNSGSEAARAVAACRYPPDGQRGVGPRRCIDYGPGFDSYWTTANDQVLVAVQIETPEAVRNAPEICATPGVDVVLLGMGDLSAGMGRFRDRHHPDVQGAIERVLQAAGAAGIAAGMAYVGSGAAARADVERGFQMIGVGTDDGFLIAGAGRELRAARGQAD